MALTTEQFSLRWNNFHSNLKSGFHDLLEHAEMVDVTLSVNGQFLQAHKIVLSICSPFFRKMFKDNPCKHPIVILQNVRYDNLKDILQFMYMGEVSVMQEHLSSFLKTAELLQVKGLTGDDSNGDSGGSHNNKEPTAQSSSSSSELAEPQNADENDIYNELIETTTETGSDSATQSFSLHHLQHYPPLSQSTPPPQTSPLPLNCAKRQAKSTSPGGGAVSKRSKLPTTNLSPFYACPPSSGVAVKPKSENDNTPKLSLEYKSCDFASTTAAIPSAPAAAVQSKEPSVKSEGDVEEAKDYSKSGTNVWKSCGTMAPAQDATTSGATIGNVDNVEQDSTLYPIDAKGHVACPYCCRKFVNRYNLKVHVRDKHESKSTDLDCQVCGKTMRNQSCLRVHMYHHRKQQMETTGIVSS